MYTKQSIIYRQKPNIGGLQSTMTPISLEKLIELYVLQKNYHQAPEELSGNETNSQKFKAYYNALLKGHNVTLDINAYIAPAKFKSQPNIPFILFNTVAGKQQKNQPLIIHVHGGPHVYITPDLYHAELAYFLAMGFAVACPNYRGSSGYSPKHNTPLEWIKLQKNWKTIDYNITGPEDVYAVAVYIKGMSYIDATNIFLRGGSFGSYINSHLLQQIQSGKFKNIFRGVHLNGGSNYPKATTLPIDLPLLISHGGKDPISSCYHTHGFMLDTLHYRSAKLIQNINQPSIAAIEIFIAHHGNHHLINPELTITMVKEYFANKRLTENLLNTYTYAKEIEHYLSLSTGFITNLLKNSTHKLFTPLHVQIMQQTLSMYAITNYLQTKYPIPPINTPTVRSSHPNAEIISCSFPTLYKVIPINLAAGYLHFGPTKALLKLYLGKAYQGIISKDLSYFLQTINCAKWAPRNTVIELPDPKLMVTNQTFFAQIIEMIDTEEAYLRENPNKFVAYHAANGTFLFLYTFINIWKIMLTGTRIPENLDTIDTMRFYDFITNSFNNAHDFLNAMQLRAKIRADLEISAETIYNKILFGTQYLFNHTNDFKDRAIACNPSLLSNNHSDACWSLWWYFKKPSTLRDKEEVFKIISSFLNTLGLNSATIINNYYKIFAELTKELEKQAIMQQIFIPLELAKKLIYVCQLWGVPFSAMFGKIAPNDLIQQLILNPELLEENIRKLYHEEFFNFEQNINFGKPISQGGIYFISLLQFRILLSFTKADGVDIKSYFRSQEQFVTMVNKLSQQIRMDFATYLANDILLTTAVTPNADRTKELFYTVNGLFFNQHTHHISLELLYKLHTQLTAGLLPLFYTKYITAASKTQKTELQQLLPPKKLMFMGYKYEHFGSEKKDFFSIFELCSHIQGFTYYDLLLDAIENSNFNQQEQQQIKEFIKLWTANKFTINSVKCKSNITISKLLTCCVDQYKYDPNKHIIIDPRFKHNFVMTINPSTVVQQEIHKAAQYILLEFNRKYTYTPTISLALP